jgi:hypothetical protein
MSSCSRCRQAHSTAKTNWNGDTVRVYFRDGRSLVGHYAPTLMVVETLPLSLAHDSPRRESDQLLMLALSPPRSL